MYLFAARDIYFYHYLCYNVRKGERIAMDHFELVSEYKPTGDQPQAIEQLVKGFKEGNQ